MRIPKGPSQVKRVAHAVLTTPKVEDTVGWFRHNLGFICSDDVYAGEKANLIGSFNRFDRGEPRRPSCVLRLRTEDRHQPHLVRGARHRRRRHGSAHLDTGKYEHMWGIGRHVLGSQVYDYWPIRGAGCTSIGPTATGSTSRTARTCFRPRRRWFRSRAIRRRRSSSTRLAGLAGRGDTPLRVQRAEVSASRWAHSQILVASRAQCSPAVLLLLRRSRRPPQLIWRIARARFRATAPGPGSPRRPSC